METNIQKCGNSLVVILPRGLTTKKSLKEGSRVIVTETKTGLAIELLEHPAFKLEELLLAITKENLHKEIDWSFPGNNPS